MSRDWYLAAPQRSFYDYRGPLSIWFTLFGLHHYSVILQFSRGAELPFPLVGAQYLSPNKEMWKTAPDGVFDMLL